jgi:hypothetical protein
LLKLNNMIHKTLGLWELLLQRQKMRFREPLRQVYNKTRIRI